MTTTTTIADAIREYCADLRAERQLPASQVRNIEYILRPVLLSPPPHDPGAPSWCAKNGVATLADLDRRRVDLLTLSIETRLKKDGTPVSAATRRTYGMALRGFLGWAGSDHVKRVGLPRLRKKRKDVLSTPECRALAEAALTLRDNLIIRILVETGVRESAISGIKKSDLIERDKKYFFLRVYDKTGERLPPITRELYHDLCDYANGTARSRSRSEALFLVHHRSHRGQEFEPIGKTGIYWAVKNAAERSGIGTDRVHPHLLRATAITRMCASGMNPIYISEITGVSLPVIKENYDNTPQEVIWEVAMRSLGVA